MKVRLALLCLVALAGCHRGEQVRFDNAPVILISIDTLRADHLPAYGYRNVDTPHLDAFRRDAILYQNAYSHCPMTLPSHLSMLTGLLPTEHGVRDNAGFHFDGAQHPSLPRLLHDRGYATGAAVSSYVLRGETGLGPLFDAYDDATSARAGAAFTDYQRPGNVTEAVAEKWIDAHDSAPFFYFFHIYEPHVPYDPPEPFRSRYATTPYDGEIATADAIVGKLLDHLKTKGIYDRAIIIVCSDHGEGLNDHGEDQHSILIYREAIHVPLMLKLPSSKRANTAVETPAQLADIFGTVLDLVGAGSGHSTLLDLPKSRKIYSESFYARYHFGWSELRSLIDDRYHVIASAPRAELYDVKADPAERHDLAANERRVASSYREELEKFGNAVPQPAPVDPETAAKLQALGYLGNAKRIQWPLLDPNQAIGTLAPMRKAIELAAAHRTVESLALFREILSHAPWMVEVWTQYGETLIAAGQPEEAIIAYREAIAHSPVASPDLILPLGSLYLQIGQLDDAQHAGELTLESNPRRAKTLLAGVALARHDYATATRYAQDVADEPEGLLLLARIADERGDYAGALRIADDVQLMAAERELLPVYRLEFVRADALARAGRIDEARAAYQREIKAFPNDLRAYTNLAVLQFLSGDHTGADATLRAMVSANPTEGARELAKRTRATLR